MGARTRAETISMRRLISSPIKAWDGIYLLFFLTWVVAYSQVSWIPVGIAPSWFPVGGPLFLASLVTGAIFWGGRADSATAADLEGLREEIASLERDIARGEALSQNQREVALEELERSAARLQEIKIRRDELAGTAKDGPCLRIARRLNRVVHQELHWDALWLQLFIYGTGGIALSSLERVVTERAIGLVLPCAILIHRALTRWTGRPGEGTQVERRARVVERLLSVVQWSFIIWVIYRLWVI